MIPAVKDFTQKAWLEQQRQLLTNTQQTQQSTQQQQQQQLPQGQADLPPAAAGVEPAASASQAVVEFSSSSSSSGVGEPLELLGKVLVTAEELRDKIAVSGMPGSGVVGCLHR
jgi:hypothetical protein